MSTDTARKSAQATRQKATGDAGKFGELAKSKATAPAGLGTQAIGDDADATVVVAAPETVFTKRYESMDEKIAVFKGELDKGVDALADDAEWHEFLDTMGKFHTYSFGNQMLIRLQRPDATRVAGFNKWKELERSVNKGEKAIGILAPKIVNVTLKDGNDKPLRDAQGKIRKERRCVGFTTAAVFDVEQTDGKPLADGQPNLTEDPPEGYVADLTAAIEAEGFTVRYDKIPGGTKGYTAGGSKLVVIDEASSPASQAKTLAHELGHIKAGHLERTEHYHTGPDGCRGEMEVEAESIAYVLSRANGMSTDINQNTSRYLNSWASRGRTDEEGRAAQRKAIADSGESVAKAVKSLLSERKWSNVTD